MILTFIIREASDFNQYNDDVADRARLRKLAIEEDWDARSLHQALEKKIDGEPHTRPRHCKY